MSDVVIKIEHVSKQYRLGRVSTKSLAHDINRWWHTSRGKEDPYLKLGEVNDRTKKSNSEYVWSLKDISFDVHQGDVLGVIGKNGAGKSTLLKILSQVTRPTTGKVKIKGRIASLLEVGTGFHPELTGRENIFLNGAILGMSKHEIRTKFDEIVSFSGIERYIDTPVKRYSSGMYVRLAFAVAAHLEPDIMIVDEVLAVGDMEFQRKCLGKMKDVSDNGRTVLFVSHNMAAVKNLCTKGIVLQNGSLCFQGTSDDAVSYYSEQLFSKAGVEFQLREDRKGTEKFKIVDIYFLDATSHRVLELISGEKYIIVFEYDCSDFVDADKFNAVIQFKNENHELVTTIATDELGVKFESLPKKGKFQIEIDKLQFREGEFTLSYMFSEKLSFSAPHSILDYLSEAVFFRVVRGDYWKSGNLNRPKGFIQESRMKIEEAK